jgi:hypothetical protein
MNPDTNSRGTITPLQISKLVPDLILHSFDDIQNTMYNMKEKGLSHQLDIPLGLDGHLESEREETQFQISVNGIIQFRKSIRPIARLALNHEEQYQTIVDKTEGDPEVKAELKELPEKIKNSMEGDSKLKAGLKKIPKKIIERTENRAYETIADSVVRYGAKAAIFVTKLIFFRESIGTDYDYPDL